MSEKWSCVSLRAGLGVEADGQGPIRIALLSCHAREDGPKTKTQQTCMHTRQYDIPHDLLIRRAFVTHGLVFCSQRPIVVPWEEDQRDGGLFVGEQCRCRVRHACLKLVAHKASIHDADDRGRAGGLGKHALMDFCEGGLVGPQALSSLLFGV